MIAIAVAYLGGVISCLVGLIIVTLGAVTRDLKTRGDDDEEVPA